MNCSWHVEFELLMDWMTNSFLQAFGFELLMDWLTDYCLQQPDVDAHDPVVLLHAGVLDRAQLDDADVVHEDVQLDELVQGGVQNVPVN